MWTVENRARYDRSHLRYPSDLTEEEWALAKVLIPRAKRGGNKRSVDGCVANAESRRAKSQRSGIQTAT